MKIYLTYCSDTKNDSLKHTGVEVTPDKLYTSGRIQSFINRCIEKGVNWAIFSDKYGVWFSNIKHKWYEKDPSTIVRKGKVIDPEKFRELVNDFNQKLQDYDEIHFYIPNPRRLHSLYKILLEGTTLKDKIEPFKYIDKII